MNKNINMERCIAISKECEEIELIIKSYEDKIKEQNERLKEREKEVKELLAKGYWWTYDIDTRYHHAKKYSIKKIELGINTFYITVKEVFKKAPWPGFTGEHYYSLNDFMKLNIYKTEQEANDAYYNRICPKCSEIMKYSTSKWCNKCMHERNENRRKFIENHRFYSPEKDTVYTVGYTDELTRSQDKGFYGKHFIIQRMDTMEIIETDNLWSSYPREDYKNNLPKIKFIKD